MKEKKGYIRAVGKKEAEMKPGLFSKNYCEKDLFKVAGFVILLSFLILLLIFLVFFPKLNIFSVKEYEIEEVFLPEVLEGGEIQQHGYKYSNHSGVIVSAPYEISCSWKPADSDDGWKICEAVFEVDNYGNAENLYSPILELNFRDAENVKNVNISYSNSFSIVEEAYIDSSLEEINETVMESKEIGRSFTAASARPWEGRIKLEKKEAVKEILREDTRAFKKRQFNDFSDFLFSLESFSESEIGNNNNSLETLRENLKATEGSIMQLKENLKATEDSIKQLKESLGEPSYVLEKVNNRFETLVEAFDNLDNATLDSASKSKKDKKEKNNGSPVLTNKKNEGSDNKDNSKEDSPNNLSLNVNQTDEKSDNKDNSKEDSPNNLSLNVNQTDEKSDNKDAKTEDKENKGKGGGINGFAISSREFVSLNLKEPFAVKVRFEIPKYSSNQFDFRIYEAGFEASIDPDVSGCGVLDTSGGTYLLDRDISSDETCFIISANNITLDCQGHRINYSSSGNGYGVYAAANFTTIKNCFIVDGNSTGNGSAIYLLDSEGSLIENNTLLTYLDYTEGIYIRGNSNIAANNNITTYGRYAYAVYLANSVNNSIANNSLATHFWDSYGIFLDSSLDTQISGNNITTFEAEAYGIRLFNSSHNSASFNNITAIEELGYPFYLASNSSYNNLSNNELAVYVKDNAVIYVDSDSNYFRNNNLTSHGNVAFGIHLRPEAQNNTFQDNRVITHGNDSYAVYLESSSDNLFLGNLFITYGYWGFIFLISGSNSNSFINNSLFTYGQWSPCVLIEGPSDGNLFSEINATTNNSFSEIFYAYNYDANFSVEDSYINASYAATEEVYLESSLIGNVWNFTNVTSFNSRWDIATSGALIVSNYLDIFTNFTNGSYAPSEIILRDKSFNEVFSGQAGRNGSFRAIIPDYIQNSQNNTIEYSNYSLNVSLGEEKFSRSLNLSESHYLSFTFDSAGYQLYNEEAYPKISFIEPTPANATIQNSTGMFVNLSVNDSEGNVSAFVDFDNSLIGWWRMDDINESGDVVDYIGGNNGSKKGNSQQTSAGRLGKGFSFDGDGDYVNLGGGNAFDLGENFSISFWIITSEIAGQPTFIGRVDEGGAYENYWYIGIKSGESKVEAGLGDGINYSIFHSVNNITGNSWCHIAWVRRGNLQEIYIDGANSTYQARYDGPIGNISLSTAAYIGGDPESDNYYFNGSIDDVMIFNKTLSAEEIYGLYANQSSGYIGINFTGLAEGSHVFRAYVQDNSGRVNFTGEREVFINWSYSESNLTNSSVPPDSDSGGSSSVHSCKYGWNCSEWGDCINEKQIRNCNHLNDRCNKQKPDTERNCKVKETKEASSERKSQQDVLFDIRLEVIKKSFAIYERLSSSVSLINLGIPGKVKANLTYIISNSDGAEVYREEEIVPVETQIEFIKVIGISEFKEGDYLLYIELKYEGQTEPANAQERFTVVETGLPNAFPTYIIVILALIFVFVFVFWTILRIYEEIKLKAAL